MKKQLRIHKMFAKRVTKDPEECDVVLEEIKNLEKILNKKQDELFQIQRNFHKQKPCISKEKVATVEYVRPQRVVYENSVTTLNTQIEVMTMLSGIEIQSYVAGDHCCIVYHMQEATECEVKHGFRINMKSGVNEIEKIQMPIGFRVQDVIEDFNEIMSPDCLTAVRKALVAYYKRLEQFETLKNLLVSDAQLFRLLDGSHIEMSFTVQKDMEDKDSQLDLLLILDYTMLDIRPKTIKFRERDLPQDVLNELNEQCVVFKRKPLAKAFKTAFIKSYGNTRYLLVRKHIVIPENVRVPKRINPNKHYEIYDETFHPEDCSHMSEDDN